MGEGASGWRLAGIPPGLGGCQLGGTKRWAAKRAAMLAEECLNDGPGNLSWGGRKMKTEGAAGEETRPSVLLSPEPTSHKGLRVGWRA